jgi:hypothetical protein
LVIEHDKDIHDVKLLIWGLNPLYTPLEASTLTITPPIRFKQTLGKVDLCLNITSNIIPRKLNIYLKSLILVPLYILAELLLFSIGGVMVSVLASSGVYSGFKP